MAAGKGGDGEAHSALEALCRAYWQPIYFYVRRKGHGPEDAKDLTQEFFSQLIAKDHFRLADQTKGKFRTFLLACLDYFLAREWSRAHRQKRGGEFTFVSLDEINADNGYCLEPSDHRTPREAYDRQWALTVLKQTMDGLEQEYQAAGRGNLFEETRHLLSGAIEGDTYDEICARLGMTQGTLRVAIHRLRQRYAQLLRNEIGRTVSRPEEIQEEIQFLLSAMGAAS